MVLLSSKTTLFFKFFLPTFWIVFFLAFAFGTFLIDIEETPYIGEVPLFMFRMGSLAFLILGVSVLYYLLLPLKRVEYKDDNLFVTNYFKSYRYTFESVEKIEEKDWYLFHSYVLVLKAAGSFGERIPFIGSRKRMAAFKTAHPSLFSNVN